MLYGRKIVSNRLPSSARIILWAVEIRYEKYLHDRMTLTGSAMAQKFEEAFRRGK